MRLAGRALRRGERRVTTTSFPTGWSVAKTMWYRGNALLVRDFEGVGPVVAEHQATVSVVDQGQVGPAAGTEVGPPSPPVGRTGIPENSAFDPGAVWVITARLFDRRIGSIA
jgi:hypothetical protein